MVVSFIPSKFKISIACFFSILPCVLIQLCLQTETSGYHGRKKLTSMVIPSIFVPEDWSFTFFEGLNRHPDSIFKDRTVAELGCGNGWISIAIAEKWLPLKVCLLSIIYPF